MKSLIPSLCAEGVQVFLATHSLFLLRELGMYQEFSGLCVYDGSASLGTGFVLVFVPMTLICTCWIQILINQLAILGWNKNYEFYKDYTWRLYGDHKRVS